MQLHKDLDNAMVFVHRINTTMEKRFIQLSTTTSGLQYRVKRLTENLTRRAKIRIYYEVTCKLTTIFLLIAYNWSLNAANQLKIRAG